MTVVLPTLGAPGVYLAPDLVAAPSLGVRMDVCAFVGVAPRGPAWERVADAGYDDDVLAARRARSTPVAVESWAEYTELFGAFEGPGLLPYAVAGFFAQGGRRAYVQRVVPGEPRPTMDPHAPGPAPDLPATEPPACAVLVFDTTQVVGAADDAVDLAGATDRVRLRARNEGSWGNRLTASLSFTASALQRPGLDAAGNLVLGTGVSVVPGDLLRVRTLDGVVQLRTVMRIDATPVRRTAVLDRIVVGALVSVDVVTATLHVVDTDPAHPREERFDAAGLRSAHPRWLGTQLGESRLVELAQVRDPGSLAHDLQAITPTDPALPAVGAVRPADGSADGQDRYPLLTFTDVLGPLGLLLGAEEVAPDGLDALAAVIDAADPGAPASLVVADLYEPREAPDRDDVGVPQTVAGPGFDLCVQLPGVPSQPAADAGLIGLRLDPSVPQDRARIVTLQQAVVSAAERLGIVALLDVPPGLRPAQVLAWRSAFDSCWAAAWHGWLRTPVGDTLVTVPPTGNAAGLIAATELSRGLPTGPALTTLAGVVAVAEGVGAAVGTLDPQQLGNLHRAGINLALPDRDGVVFSAARTLAGDPQWRQLTARRVVAMIERSVRSGLAWAAFEPNDTTLRTRIATAVDALLRELFAAGAFAGATPADSYFVRTSPPGAVGAPGEADLVCEIGVAPSEPTEYLLVRVLRADDGTLTTEAPA